MQLVEPAPNTEQLESILRCGLTAPDHAGMRPWRFITISGQARAVLGDIFAEVAIAEDPGMSAEKVARIRQKPMRSPLIVVIVATITADHPKTPEIEQVLSAGAATMLIQLAATAKGFGSIWLTGPNAYNKQVKQSLGVDSKDHIVGFVYLGTPVKAPLRKLRPDISAHLSEWQPL